MNYRMRYPGVYDLEARARRRMPRFAGGYLVTGVGREAGLSRNTAAMDRVNLVPRYLVEMDQVETGVTLFGRSYAQPFGVCPVGFGNLMWPGAERAIASAARAANIPYTLSNMSNTSLEEIADIVGDGGWFQFYPTRKEKINADLLRRAHAAGYSALVVTVDIPTGAKRDTELRAGVALPPLVNGRFFWELLTHPAWSFGTLRAGVPKMATIEPYRAQLELGNVPMSDMISQLLCPGVSLEMLKSIRGQWDGPLLVKGILRASEARRLVDLGVDGIWVSNHGGRQCDAAPASIDVVASVRDAVPDATVVILDSGVRAGIDVLRGCALGADACFSGRGFFYGVAALGAPGAGHVIDIYSEEVERGLKQLGCPDITTLDQRWLAA